MSQTLVKIVLNTATCFGCFRSGCIFFSFCFVVLIFLFLQNLLNCVFLFLGTGHCLCGGGGGGVGDIFCFSMKEKT